MIVITTPTGDIGSQVVAQLLAKGTEPLRLITRHPSRLSDQVRDQTEVIAGSHADPNVLDHALAGANGLFWLVPPNTRAESADAHYLSFARPAVTAIRRHEVAHVVAVSSAGWSWPHSAGLLSAAHLMDRELEQAGSAYRSLGAGFFMENLIRPLPEILSEGLLSLPLLPDRLLPLTATRDIAGTAAALLIDRSWDGSARLPLFSADDLTPNAMATTIGNALGRSVMFEQIDITQLVASMIARGTSDAMARDFAAMYQAQQDGIYDEHWEHAPATPTSFRTWCESVLVAAR